MDAQDTVRDWIVQILSSRPDVIGAAARQRAKFEGWLKFELAASANAFPSSEAELEAPYGSGKRADLSVCIAGTRHFIELKTSNTNWRMAGAIDKHRPITKNVSSITADARKLQEEDVHGIVAFVLFPVPASDTRWHDHLARVSQTLDLDLSEGTHCTRVRVPLTSADECEAVVCCFKT